MGFLRFIFQRRKTSELALKQSEEQLRLVLQAYYIGTWDWNTLTNEISCSSNCEQLFDLNIGTGNTLKTFINRVHPQDRKTLTKALHRTKKSHQKFQQEYRVVWQDGSIHWIEAIGNFGNDSYRHPNHMLGVVIDITEHKLAEQQIYEQASLLDVTTNAILLQKLDGTITYWNQGAERLYGWTAEEAIGKNIIELLFKEHAPEAEAALNNVLSIGKWQGELHQITKNTQDVIVDSHWTLVQDAKNQPKHILSVDIDITATKQLELLLLRTQRLDNIGLLAGGIAHDLNNILTPILAISQLLPLTLPSLNQRNQEMLNILETSTKRGRDLVKQILSFARDNDNGERLIVQVRHLLLDIEQISLSTFPKSIEFKRDIADNLWTVNANATQLHQVFMNLAINARDAMPSGGTLSVTASNQVIDINYAKMNTEAQEGKYIVVAFCDTGTGIAENIIDKIFDPFFTTKEPGKGTGLGLPSVLNIVRSHGGFIEVCSNNKGSGFRVFLPALMQADTAIEEDINIVQGQGELVLFVDDESAISEVSKNTLEIHNYQVLTANNGIEAIASYVQNKLTIKTVIIDLIMPILDGVTTIKILQKITPNIKIIAMSGSNDDEEKIKALECGVKDFLDKPFTANVLLKALHQLFNND